MSNWSSNGYIDPDTCFAQQKGRKKSISRAFVRQLAAEDSSNRATCAVCGKTYGASYVKLARISWIKIDHVCADCRKANHYELA